MKNLTLIVCSLASASLSLAAAQAPDIDRIVKQSRFEEIAATTNYLLVVVENSLKNPPPPPILKCDPKGDVAQAWLSGPVHEMVDAKHELELKTYLAHPKSYQSRMGKCAKTCSCNSFLSLLDAANDTISDNADHQANRKIVEALATKEDQEKSIACAKSFHEFCGSKIEKFLRGAKEPSASARPEGGKR